MVQAYNRSAGAPASHFLQSRSRPSLFACSPSFGDHPGPQTAP